MSPLTSQASPVRPSRRATALPTISADGIVTASDVVPIAQPGTVAGGAYHEMGFCGISSGGGNVADSFSSSLLSTQLQLWHQRRLLHCPQWRSGAAPCSGKQRARRRERSMQGRLLE